MNAAEAAQTSGSDSNRKRLFSPSSKKVPDRNANATVAETKPSVRRAAGSSVPSRRDRHSRTGPPSRTSAYASTAVYDICQ